DFDKAGHDRQPSQAREIRTSYLRTRLIEALITGAADEFLSTADDIFSHQVCTPLLGRDSEHSKLYEALKSFAVTHAYMNPSVMRIELEGSIVISRLMEWFWKAIIERKEFQNLGSRRTSAFASYAYALISDNYRCRFED